MSREITVPFQVSPSGSIDFTLDPVEQARQHIQAAIMTGPGERVMRPGYGVRVYQTLFDLTEPAAQAGMAADMRMSIASNVPEVNVVGIRFETTGPTNEILIFYISFALVGSEEIHEAAIAVGGTVSERTFSA